MKVKMFKSQFIAIFFSDIALKAIDFDLFELLAFHKIKYCKKFDSFCLIFSQINY
jgi:hypothetical protein